jgi:hypothetical protein
VAGAAAVEQRLVRPDTASLGMSVVDLIAALE